MSIEFRASILAVAVILLMGSAALAEDVDFDLGSREWNVQTRFLGERTGEDEWLADASLGYGYYFLDRAVVEGQLVGYYTHDDQDALGIGLNLVARYHFLVIDRFSLYGEIGCGVLETTENFPDGGTNLNFTYFGGPGASYRINDSYHLVGGLLFQHISNGFIEGRDRNPILNSLGGYVGVMHTF